jgi:hypothetical protein
LDYRVAVDQDAATPGHPLAVLDGRTSLEEEEAFMPRTLLDKVWDAHTVRTLPSGQTQLLVGLHLIHEVTTPQAFQMLKELKLRVRMPERMVPCVWRPAPPKPPGLS